MVLKVNYKIIVKNVVHAQGLVSRSQYQDTINIFFISRNPASSFCTSSSKTVRYSLHVLLAVPVFWGQHSYVLRCGNFPGNCSRFAILLSFTLVGHFISSFQFSMNIIRFLTTFFTVQDSGTSMNKYLATVILGVVRLVATIAACIALRRCGRRPLTMISGIKLLAKINCGEEQTYKLQMRDFVTSGLFSN